MGFPSEKVTVQTAGSRVAYERPRLVVLGTVAELTRGALGNATDNHANGSR
jgi:hypothetical protein